MTIHLSKSNAGHVSVKEVLDIQCLLKKINEHPQFRVQYFASDGESGLNGFHQTTYDKYSEKLKDVLNGTISIEQFIEHVFFICKVLPIIDMLHVAKSGRNRIIKNTMKLGDSCDLINSEILENDLEIHNKILFDHSSLGKMKDTYPLNSN